MRQRKIPLPTFEYEQELYKKGYQFVIGIDEVGCGALAGAVYAGAVIFPKTFSLKGINESKALSSIKREEWVPIIKEQAIAWSIGIASVEEIAQMNIRQATFLAMRRAIEQIPQGDHLLVDAWTIPHVSLPQKSVIKGDQNIISIAAASILAKVTRDHYMVELHEIYPEYGFADHKGYGTKKHQLAITKY